MKGSRRPEGDVWIVGDSRLRDREERVRVERGRNEREVRSIRGKEKHTGIPLPLQLIIFLLQLRK